MSLVLVWGARIPLVRIGRIAGQYMKPRSSPKEKNPEGDGEILAYVNSFSSLRNYSTHNSFESEILANVISFSFYAIILHIIDLSLSLSADNIAFRGACGGLGVSVTASRQFQP